MNKQSRFCGRAWLIIQQFQFFLWKRCILPTCRCACWTIFIFFFLFHSNSFNDYFNSIIFLTKIMRSWMCSLVPKPPEIWKTFDKLRWEGWGTHGTCDGFQKSWHKPQKFLQIFCSEALVLIDARRQSSEGEEPMEFSTGKSLKESSKLLVPGF